MRAFIFAAMALSFWAVAPAFAGTGTPSAPTPSAAAGPPGPGLDRMAKALDLTPDQQAKLKVIFDDAHKQMEALHEQVKKQVRTVLTPEQAKKMDEMEHRHRMFRRHHKDTDDDDAPDAPPGS